LQISNSKIQLNANVSTHNLVKVNGESEHSYIVRGTSSNFVVIQI